MTTPEQIRKNNILYQQQFAPDSFADHYLLLRQKENRIFSNEELKMLPDVPPNHPLKREWDIRKHTLKNLINYLQKKKLSRVLELGCGNGWLSHRLAKSLIADIYAMDVNEKELLQGASVFEIKNLHFIFGDIFTYDFNADKFDIIVLAASVQYFPDFTQIIKRLLSLLKTDGEIHIVDSPFYDMNDVDAARKRSETYFNKLGFPEMSAHYYHRTWQEIEGFNCTLLYDPSAIMNRIKKYMLPVSPFPWIKIEV